MLAGTVVVLGGATGLTCGIAHVNIPANIKGALAAGGAVYKVISLNSAANYAKVYLGQHRQEGDDRRRHPLRVRGRRRRRRGQLLCYVLHHPYV